MHALPAVPRRTIGESANTLYARECRACYCIIVKWKGKDDTIRSAILRYLSLQPEYTNSKHKKQWHVLRSMSYCFLDFPLCVFFYWCIFPSATYADGKYGNKVFQQSCQKKGERKYYYDKIFLILKKTVSAYLSCCRNGTNFEYLGEIERKSFVELCPLASEGLINIASCAWSAFQLVEALVTGQEKSEKSLFKTEPARSIQYNLRTIISILRNNFRYMFCSWYSLWRCFPLPGTWESFS